MARNKATLKNKIYRKCHFFFWSILRPGVSIRNCYPAYRHGIQFQGEIPEIDQKSTVYITQVPNEGAGIGHQLANYIGGVHYAELFHVNFAYPGFKDAKWESFFGFDEGEKSIRELKKAGYKLLRLPYFDEEKDADLIRKIIASYEGQKVILQTELDQFYQKQYEVIPYIKKKFESASARKKEVFPFDRTKTNIAVHLRRGDIVKGQSTGEVGLTKRWLSTEYFLNATKSSIKLLCEKGVKKEDIVIHIFSQGKDSDYQAFEKLGVVEYHLDENPIDSFLKMVRSDLLIISKSSFSYKPALLADGIRVCPREFWHGYPEDEKWMITKEDGSIDDGTSC